MRWSLLKAPEKQTVRQLAKLHEVQQTNKRMYRAFLLFNELRWLYRVPKDEAREHLHAWLAWASRSRLKPFVTLARTLRKHKAGLLAAIELGGTQQRTPRGPQHAAPATPWWSPNSIGSPGHCQMPVFVEELTSSEVKLNIGGSVHDPNDPIGRLLFNVLAMIAEFESDLIRMRTREGMKVAKAKGRLRGKAPKLSPAQETHLVGLYRAGKHTTAELAELFSVGRSTVYRAVQRAGEPKVLVVQT